MHLMDRGEMTEAAIRHTFQNVSWKGLAVVVLVMAAITGYTAIPKGEPTAVIFITIPALVTAFFAALLALRYYQSRNPRNWLLKLADEGVYVNLQSEITTPAASGVPEVFFISREDVVAVARVRELRTLPQRHGHHKSHYDYFDLVVGHDLPEALLVALAQIRRNPRLKRGTGIRRDFLAAVRLEDARTLRLVWDWMTPREDEAAKIFATVYEVKPRRKINTPKWEGLSPEDRDRYIDTLWEWGHVEDAIQLSALTRKTSAQTAARYLADRLG